MRIAFDVGNVLVGVNFDRFFGEFKELGLQENPMTFLCDIQARQDIGIKTLQVALKAKFGLNERQLEPFVKSWNDSIEPNDEMLDFVDFLKENGAEVAILSNMGLEHAAYIREKYPRIFDGCKLHLSCEVGARKPTKLFYQSFLMQHPKFARALFLDDRSENIKMANEMGLNGQEFRLDEFESYSKTKKSETLNKIIKGITYFGGPILGRAYLELPKYK